jgi:hypothetical protein
MQKKERQEKISRLVLFVLRYPLSLHDFQTPACKQAPTRWGESLAYSFSICQAFGRESKNSFGSCGNGGVL